MNVIELSINRIIDEIQQKLHILLKNIQMIEMCVFKIELRIFWIFDQILHCIRNFKIIRWIIFWNQSKRRRTITTIIDMFFDIFIVIKKIFFDLIAQRRYTIYSLISCAIFCTSFMTFWFFSKIFIIDLRNDIISNVAKRVFKIVITALIFRNRFFFRKIRDI